MFNLQQLPFEEDPGREDTVRVLLYVDEGLRLFVPSINDALERAYPLWNALIFRHTSRQLMFDATLKELETELKAALFSSDAGIAPDHCVLRLRRRLMAGVLDLMITIIYTPIPVKSVNTPLTIQ